MKEIKRVKIKKIKKVKKLVCLGNVRRQFWEKIYI